jgi:hypothetical protein
MEISRARLVRSDAPAAGGGESGRIVLVLFC